MTIPSLVDNILTTSHEILICDTLFEKIRDRSPGFVIPENVKTKKGSNLYDAFMQISYSLARGQL